MKLRNKILVALSALSLLFSIVMVTERATGFRRALLERTQDRTEYLSSFVIELSAHYLETGNLQRLKEILRSFDHFKNITYLRIVDSKGGVVYRMAEPGVKLTEKKADEDVFHPVDEIFDVSREIISNGVNVGEVQLGISVKGVDEAVANMAWRGILIGLVFTAFITFLAWFLSIKLGKELSWLLTMAENVKSGELPALPSGTLGSDTGSIARTLKDLHSGLKREEGLRLEAETQRNEFFAMTVHDLKQPVTALKAALDLLLSEEEAKTFDKKQLASLTQIARTSLGMLTTMISDVLNTSKLNDPATQVEKDRVPLGDFLRDCAAENSASVAAAGRKWMFSLPEEADSVWMFADRDLVRRGIGNLVLNAIQYTPKGGAIKLGAGFRENGMAAIYVSDEGEGIPENFREEIFKKYSTMGKSSKNLGLGLAFCKLVADRHAARLDVRSEAGKGTEISFVIPVSAENAGGVRPGPLRGENS